MQLTYKDVNEATVVLRDHAAFTVVRYVYASGWRENDYTPTKLERFLEFMIGVIEAKRDADVDSSVLVHCM